MLMNPERDSCPACKGEGELEYEEERSFNGKWRRRIGPSDPLWPQLCEDMPRLARYQRDTCEVCEGTGEVACESFRGVRIF